MWSWRPFCNIVAEKTEMVWKWSRGGCVGCCGRGECWWSTTTRKVKEKVSQSERVMDNITKLVRSRGPCTWCRSTDVKSNHCPFNPILDGKIPTLNKNNDHDHDNVQSWKQSMIYITSVALYIYVTLTTSHTELCNINYLLFLVKIYFSFTYTAILMSSCKIAKNSLQPLTTHSHNPPPNAPCHWTTDRKSVV